MYVDSASSIAICSNIRRSGNKITLREKKWIRKPRLTLEANGLACLS